MQFAGLSFSFFAWPGIQVRFNEHKPTISLSFLDLFTIDAHAVFKVKLTEIDWLTQTTRHIESKEKAAPLRLGVVFANVMTRAHIFAASTVAMTDLNGLQNLMADLAEFWVYSF